MLLRERYSSNGSIADKMLTQRRQIARTKLTTIHRRIADHKEKKVFLDLNDVGRLLKQLSGLSSNDEKLEGLRETLKKRLLVIRDEIVRFDHSVPNHRISISSYRSQHNYSWNMVNKQKPSWCQEQGEMHSSIKLTNCNFLTPPSSVENNPHLSLHPNETFSDLENSSQSFFKKNTFGHKLKLKDSLNKQEISKLYFLKKNDNSKNKMQNIEAPHQVSSNIIDEKTQRSGIFESSNFSALSHEYSIGDLDFNEDSIQIFASDIEDNPRIIVENTIPQKSSDESLNKNFSKLFVEDSLLDTQRTIGRSICSSHFENISTTKNNLKEITTETAIGNKDTVTLPSSHEASSLYAKNVHIISSVLIKESEVEDSSVASANVLAINGSLITQSSELQDYSITEDDQTEKGETTMNSVTAELSDISKELEVAKDDCSKFWSNFKNFLSEACNNSKNDSANFFIHQELSFPEGYEHHGPALEKVLEKFNTNHEFKFDLEQDKEPSFQEILENWSQMQKIVRDLEMKDLEEK